MLNRRQFVAGTLMATCAPRFVFAESFPTKAITVVIPYGAGGSSDLTIRVLAPVAPEFLGEPLVIQLKPGGAGAIASQMVAQAKPDGHTILFGHANCNSVLPAVEPGRSKGPDDLASVCRINTTQQLFLCQPDAPFKTFREMIAWAKANPGKLVIGNIGVWSAIDFTWKRLERAYGLKTRSVTFDGGGEALVALLGGHVQVAQLSTTQSLPQVKAGKLRPLAYTGDQRYRELPDVPTTKEEGFTGALSVWKAVLAPKKTPRPIIEKLATGFKKMIETEQAQTGIKNLGERFNYLGPDEFETVWRKEYQTYKELGRLFKQSADK